MKLKNYFLYMLAAGAMIACSDDIDGPNNKEIEPNATLSLAIESNLVSKAGVAINNNVDPERNVIKDITVAVFDDGAYGGTYTNNLNPLKAVGTITLAEDAPVKEVTDIEIVGGKLKVLVLVNVQDKLSAADKAKLTTNSNVTLDAVMKMQTDLDDESANYLTMSSAVISVTTLENYLNCLGYTADQITGKSPHAINDLEMIDSRGLSTSTEVTEKGVKVYRTPSRVQLNSIILSTEETDFGTAISLKIDSVFVVNVKQYSNVASANAWGFVESTTNQWYDGAFASNVFPGTGVLKQHGVAGATNYENLLEDAPAKLRTLTSDYKTFYPKFYFYIYENGVLQNEVEAVDNHTGDYTLLVIRGDYTYYPKNSTVPRTEYDKYYPVVVNKGTNNYDGVTAHEYVKRNVKYYINLTITGPGYDEPFTPNKNACLAADVKVLDWNVVLMDPELD